uniref:Uncharacterized protein n=1 Tax=viral metagenome TaxID=1070528 RepID=A0A6C0ES56_9ZZZZ
METIPITTVTPHQEKEPISDKIVWFQAITRGSLSAVTKEYLKCVEKCYKLYVEGRIEKRPYFRKRTKGEQPSISHSFKQKRFKIWKRNNTLLEHCLENCKNKWYTQVVDIIGEENYKLNEDILQEILGFLKVSEKKSTKKKETRKGGRKTRRKKGTKRKRRRGTRKK